MSKMFPAVFTANAETNLFLKKLKTQLEGKLSFSNPEGMQECADLCWYLFSIRRKNEALIAASFLTESVSFAGNAAVWPAVGTAIALEAHMRKAAGDPARAKQLLKKLVDHPARSDAKSFVEALAQKMDPRYQEAIADNTPKGTAKLARVCGDLMYYKELSEPEMPFAGMFDRAAVDALYAKALQKLDDRV